MRIIDLSAELYTAMPVYPGDPEVVIEQIHSLDNEGWRLRYLQMPSHIGAHADAFSHMDKDGKSLSELPIDRFIGPTRKVKTGDKYPKDTGLMFAEDKLDVAAYGSLIDANPLFVVVGDNASMSVELERLLLHHEIITITDLINLDKLPYDREFTLYTVPLRIRDGDGSPVRAFAIIEHDED